MNYSLQLYSVRDAAKENYGDMLRAVAEIGYHAVETAGFYGLSAEEFSSLLKEYGLKISGTHTQIWDVADHFEEVVAYHHTIGCTDLIIPGAAHETAEDTTWLVEKINQYQPLLKAEGIDLHYHNHSFEFLPNKDGEIMHNELAERTDVLFELDTFWIYNAGRSPLELMEKYRGRVKFIHLKDGLPQDYQDPNRKAIGKSLGSGLAPVAGVRKKAIEMGLGMVVESENLDPNGLEEVRRCMEYLKSLEN